MSTDGGLFDQVKDFIKAHPEQVRQGLDKAEEVADERTGGRYADQVGRAGDAVGEQLGLPPEEPAPEPGPLPTPGEPAPAPAPGQPAPGQPSPPAPSEPPPAPAPGQPSPAPKPGPPPAPRLDPGSER